LLWTGQGYFGHRVGVGVGLGVGVGHGRLELEFFADIRVGRWLLQKLWLMRVS
jgi:hypothetical protein